MVRMSFRDWVAGARPHTWANAISPVIYGTAAAGTAAHPGKALLALVVAWSLIVGVNYANDYSDGIRGTDADRSGPTRLTASGLARPRQVRAAAFACFGVAAAAGLVLSLMSAPWLIAVGAACIAGAWFYTGGKNPYGYRGFGEASVFVFFGLVAVLGTEFTQSGTITWVGVVGAVAIGATSAAVNLANNIRDIPSDEAANKLTLAVKLGQRRARGLFSALVTAPLIGSVLLAWHTPWALAGLAVAPLTRRAARPIRAGATGARLIPVLGSTGKAMLVWSIVTAAALAVKEISA